MYNASGLPFRKMAWKAEVLTSIVHVWAQQRLSLVNIEVILLNDFFGLSVFYTSRGNALPVISATMYYCKSKSTIRWEQFSPSIEKNIFGAVPSLWGWTRTPAKTKTNSILVLVFGKCLSWSTHFAKKQKPKPFSKWFLFWWQKFQPILMHMLVQPILPQPKPFCAFLQILARFCFHHK